MILRSFDAWSKLGYKINKGSKAHWVDGKPLFDEYQVTHTFLIREYDEDVEFDPRYEINN